jgi:class 3 adenylate cyclase
MFCDLVGSTELASRLDPEDLREVIGRYHARVAETVRRFDGFVAKYMGDGVLVYFGYPQAHEDDAEQAVRAGLALVDAVRELPAPRPLEMRIGIASGLVVVGDLIGEGDFRERGIVGETPNLAARLQTLAHPGIVVISDSARRQIGSLFEMHDLGRQSLKGYVEEQLAWRVLSENRALGRFEALRGAALAPLVGREEELELLLRGWEQVKAGNGKVVLISGEPGIGKSRLTRPFQDAIAGQPHIELRFFCSAHHQDSALYPHITQLGRAAGFARDDTDEAKLAKLDAVLAQSDATDDAVALIAELLSIPTDQSKRIQQLNPHARRERTFAALLVQLSGLAARNPVLMVYEDLHWIDPTSRELLDLTIKQLEQLPVLVLATFRPEFQPPWVGQRNVTTLALSRLNRRNVVVVVENIAGNNTLTGDVVHEIADRTDGVPLFVEEMTKAVVEAGPRAVATVPHLRSSVPATLQASLVARLDRLGAAAKDIAQRNAVIGREFGYELLALVAERPEPVLREALDRLIISGLLFERGTPPLSIDPAWVHLNQAA